MFTFAETRKLINQALENPDVVKDSMEYVEDFIDEFEEVYEDNKPKNLENEEQHKFYNKMVSEYMRERACDIS